MSGEKVCVLHPPVVFKIGLKRAKTRFRTIKGGDLFGTTFPALLITTNPREKFGNGKVKRTKNRRQIIRMLNRCQGFYVRPLIDWEKELCPRM